MYNKSNLWYNILMNRLSISTIVLAFLLLIPSTFFLHRSPSVKPMHFSHEDIYWMAKNVYYEAGNQEGAGLLAVMHVTMNRVNDDRFPKTIKEVVTQKNGKVCQFSWYCMKKLPYDEKRFLQIYDYVKAVLPFLYVMNDVTKGAIYYHATYVKPYWAKVKQRTIKIGDHIFYREKIVL